MNDPSYLEKERKRAAENRVPARLLTDRKLMKCRENNRDYCKKYRQKKKAEKENDEASNESMHMDVTPMSPEEESDITSSSSGKIETSTKLRKLIVKLDFGKQGKNNKMRSKALRRSWYQKDALNKKMNAQRKAAEKWRKKYKRLEKRVLEKNVERTQCMPSTAILNQELTPKSKTANEIRETGLSPRSLPKRIVKRLELGNCLAKEIEDARNENKKRKEKSAINRVLSGNISKKYRLGSLLKREFKVRHSIAGTMVYVSDLNHHNSTAVLAILRSLVPQLKEKVPELKMVHYWTDSPSSQYRNRFMFHVYANHQQFFGVDARWNYFEAGHGKGPCDGIGGTCKRRASEAVKQDKAIIQDVRDLYKWATESGMAIQYFFYSQTEYDAAAAYFASLTLKVVPGTLSLHAVCMEKENLMTRVTSCYCNGCLSMEDVCQGWQKHPIKRDSHDHASDLSSNEQMAVTSNLEINDVSIDEYVAAVYQDEWYIGKVCEIDQDDKEIEVSFLQLRKMAYQWPSRPDKLYICLPDLLCKINAPTATGKTGRMLKLDDSERDKIVAAFHDWKQK